jgi:glycolate oxidase
MTSQTAYPHVTPELISRLKEIAGEKNVLVDEGKENYSRDEAPHSRNMLPEVVVIPISAEVISRTLILANQKHIPVTPRGAGTGISGGSVPIFGGISLSLERLNRIIEIDEANFCVTVESGVILSDLCHAVEQRGLYYPPYPGEMNAAIGGNIATNAGGMRAVKYGVTRNFVLGLEAVLPTGEIIETGGKYIKSSTGYDLTQLLIGSEGTLAVISKAILKLITPPGSRELMLIPFNSLTEAIRFVPVILREKILPVSIEFMERDILRLVQKYTGKELPVKSYAAYLMLMIECDSADEFCHISEQIQNLCLRYGAVDAFVPASESAKRRLLELREKFYPTMQHCGMLDIADVVVPRSQIAEFVEKVKEISRKYAIPVIAYGHAGDGNVHLHPLSQGADKDAHVKELLAEIYKVGISLGGTISGEHGLGSEKKDYLPLAATREKLDLMRRLKLAFDPNQIMNPGKVLVDPYSGNCYTSKYDIM